MAKDSLQALSMFRETMQQLIDWPVSGLFLWHRQSRDEEECQLQHQDHSSSDRGNSKLPLRVSSRGRTAWHLQTCGLCMFSPRTFFGRRRAYSGLVVHGPAADIQKTHSRTCRITKESGGDWKRCKKGRRPTPRTFQSFKTRHVQSRSV